MGYTTSKRIVRQAGRINPYGVSFVFSRPLFRIISFKLILLQSDHILRNRAAVFSSAAVRSSNGFRLLCCGGNCIIQRNPF